MAAAAARVGFPLFAVEMHDSIVTSVLVLMLQGCMRCDGAVQGLEHLVARHRYGIVGCRTRNCYKNAKSRLGIEGPCLGANRHVEHPLLLLLGQQ